jgi:alkanesulfonate monooxygenase SsuD/methylene tetrahydromethanopterin reductase-like flavin-dependent oxidoreductase (luciferase family)
VAKARAAAEDMLWFWDSWSKPFGQDYPELLIGDPDTVSRRIEEAARTIPINECFLLLPQGIHDRDRSLKSLEPFATRVMPRFAGR